MPRAVARRIDQQERISNVEETQFLRAPRFVAVPPHACIVAQGPNQGGLAGVGPANEAHLRERVTPFRERGHFLHVLEMDVAKPKNFMA